MKRSIVRALCLLVMFFGISNPPAHALQVKDGKVIFEALDDYRKCQDRGGDIDTCKDALNAWISDHPSDAFKAGKLVRHMMSTHWSAIPYFAIAFDKALPDASCKDDDLKMAVDAARELPGPNDKNEIRAQAKKIYCETCSQVFNTGNIASKRFCGST